MQKRKLFRSALAMGMAFSLAAAPIGYAETIDETEVVQEIGEKLEDTLKTVDDSVKTVSAYGTEAYIDVRFGDALYNLAAQSGQDLTWLKDVYAFVKLVPAESEIQGDFTVMMNDTILCDAVASVDLSDGTVYLSIPQFFDDTVTFNVNLLKDSVLSGSGDFGQAGSMEGGIVQILSSVVAQAAAGIVKDMMLIPAETWQEEVMNYVMPVMVNLTQESGTDVITIGDQSANVNTMTFRIPSEAMGDVISGTLESLAYDPVVETFLNSEGLSTLLGTVSMLSAGNIPDNGEDVLAMYRTMLLSLAEADYSQVPGVAVTLQTGTDKTAQGIVCALEAGGQDMILGTEKFIADGDSHWYEAAPGEMLLAMFGMDPSASVLLTGTGSTAGGMLNEEIDVTVNGNSVASFTVKDFDLAALMEGKTIGDIHMELAGMKLDISYTVDQNDTRLLDYKVNDELFYHMEFWAGDASTDEMGEIDKEHALALNSIQEIQNWLGSFNQQGFLEILADAGVPAGQAGGAGSIEAQPEAAQ